MQRFELLLTMKTILYIHGMGGGEDSRIPALLGECFRVTHPEIRVVIRTYPFNPKEAESIIENWYHELHPDLVIGESLGSIHALGLLVKHPHFPLLLVSPALNVAAAFAGTAYLSLIPGIREITNRAFKPKSGRRQTLDFRFANLSAWKGFRCIPRHASELKDVDIHAFIGTDDHYRRYGIVSLRRWKRLFGRDSVTIYAGTHFMEEDYVFSMLVPMILSRMVSVADKTDCGSSFRA